MLFVPQDHKCKNHLQMYKKPQTTEDQAETLFYKPLVAPRVFGIERLPFVGLL